jgi:cbb3-type cytochrome oxidase maturation protein
MDAIYLLIPIALILIVAAVTVFLWAVKNDQFEDLEGPAHSILFDNDKIPSSKPSSDARKAQPLSKNHSNTTSKER